MAERLDQGALRAHLSRLVDIAASQGVPQDIAREARSATARALVEADSPHEVLLRRAESYFWAVVRRRLVRRRCSSPATARFVLAAVVEDLMESGRDASAVWAEIERGWSDKVPHDVLEEFRLRMCA